MTLDLVKLRRLSEACLVANTWKVLPDGSKTPDLDASRRFLQTASPEVALELLDRLESAEWRLDLLRARIHAYAGREELLAILSTSEALYPTLMTQVGKEKP
jgi:hypothetical protein